MKSSNNEHIDTLIHITTRRRDYRDLNRSIIEALDSRQMRGERRGGGRIRGETCTPARTHERKPPPEGNREPHGSRRYHHRHRHRHPDRSRRRTPTSQDQARTKSQRQTAPSTSKGSGLQKGQPKKARTKTRNKIPQARSHSAAGHDRRAARITRITLRHPGRIRRPGR